MSSTDRNLLFALSSQITAATARTANYLGTAFDTVDYEGTAKVILQISAISGTTETLDLKLQSSATSGGTYADIPGATYPQITTTFAAGVAEINFNVAAAQRFVKVVGTIGGTSPSYTIGEIFVGFKKYQ